MIQFSDDPEVAKKHEFRKVGNVHQLIIRNVHPDDAGNYTMEVGKERFDAVLTVKGDESLIYVKRLLLHMYFYWHISKV